MDNRKAKASAPVRPERKPPESFTAAVWSHIKLPLAVIAADFIIAVILLSLAKCLEAYIHFLFSDNAEQTNRLLKADHLAVFIVFVISLTILILGFAIASVFALKRLFDNERGAGHGSPI